MSNKVTFSQGSEQSIPESKIPGRLLFTTDTGKIFLDIDNNNRIQMGDKNQTVNYSTQEHEVGTWIDGSKLYEITVSTEITQDGTVYTDVSDLGIDKVIDIKSLALNSTISGSVVSVMTDSNGITTYYFQGNLCTMTALQEAFYHPLLTGYITIRYTKVGGNF